MSGEETSYSQPHLHRIDPGVWGRQSGVRDVHVAQLEAHVVPLAKDVHAQGSLVHKVDRVRSGRDIVVCEDGSAREFEIGGESAMALKVPL